MTTISRLMFDTDAQGARVLAQQLGTAGLDVSHVRVGGLSVEPPEVSGALMRAFDVPVGNLALDGWQAHARVAHARARTAAAPGSREVVELGEHELSIRQSPVVEAWVGGASVELLHLSLELGIRVAAAALTVQDGRVVDVRPGPAGGRVVLSAEGRKLLTRDFHGVDLTPGTGETTTAKRAPVG